MPAMLQWKPCPFLTCIVTWDACFNGVELVSFLRITKSMASYECVMVDPGGRTTDNSQIRGSLGRRSNGGMSKSSKQTLPRFLDCKDKGLEIFF